jgi:hypothetical protein
MATQRVYIISSDYLKENTAIDPNVDAEELMNLIYKTQGIVIEAICGTALYRDILANGSANTLSPAYLNLLDVYLKPCLAEWTYYYSLPNLWAKTTNKSVSTSNSDNANPISLEDLKYIREGIRDVAEFLESKAIKYLKANPDTFPLYLNAGSNTDTVHPRNNSLFSGIMINRRKMGGNSNDFIFDSK